MLAHSKVPEEIRKHRMPRVPRLPLDGNIDLTYRCNNICRHCWIRLPQRAHEKDKELSFDEIRRVVEDARAIGCRRWVISGGEPMLHPEFIEIFDYITRRSASYSLNTNGTLITPAIARLMTRKGCKMVALYGAAAEVHDHITRVPGSFEATLQGLAYLREAGARFTVQLVPMRDNYHQWDEMVRLARSLSFLYRVGAVWLYLSACGSQRVNREILRQRLDPAAVVRLDPPDVADEEAGAGDAGLDAETCSTCGAAQLDDRLFAACIAGGGRFHINPYGGMTFCSFIQDPTLRYDLRRGTFREAWEEFIPALADKVRGGSEYQENCGSCANRADCRWCAVYGYLENGRFSAPVPYLCAVAKENRRFREDLRAHHRRYFEIAGITIRVDSDLPVTDRTFAAGVMAFEVAGPGEDTICLRLHFGVPHLNGRDLGQLVYRKAPWAIYRRNRSWIYLGISPEPDDHSLSCVATFNEACTRGRICTDQAGEDLFRSGGVRSLTLFPTDQVLLARVLADRQACYLHAAGMIIDRKGMVFAGHSEAGKSTIATMLRDEGEILCDDRIIVRRWPDGFRVHGTWSHGDVPQVSPASAPLRAIFFLEKASENRLTPVLDRREIARTLPFLVIKPLATADWWEKILDLIEKLAREVPVYRLQFDKTGRVKDILKELT
jgi:MoaA/NifB/PqqE/SkfB family radical SAM enzyme